MYLWCVGQWRRTPGTVAAVMLGATMGLIVVDLVMLGQWLAHRPVGHFFNGWRLVLIVGLWFIIYLRFVRLGDAESDRLIGELERLRPKTMRREIRKVWAVVGMLVVVHVATMIVLGYED